MPTQPSSRLLERSSQLPAPESNHDRVGEPPKPLAVSIKDFCRLTSLGRTTAFFLIRDQVVETRRIRGRTLILMRSIEALLDLNASTSD